MRIFATEADLLAKLEQLDRLVLDCARGQLDFSVFKREYDNAYDVFALDGHESDATERGWLTVHSEHIELHRRIRDEVLYQVCSEADSRLPAYQQAGRFGPAEAERRVRILAAQYLELTPTS